LFDASIGFGRSVAGGDGGFKWKRHEGNSQ
jgi:hypothetical protein